MKTLTFLRNNIILFLLVVLILNIITMTFFIKNEKVEIKLLGDETINLTLNDIYTDPGFVLTKGNKALSSSEYKYTSRTNIDNTKTGSYDYTYSVKYKKDEYTINRTVNVVDLIKPNLAVENKEVTRDMCSNTLTTNLSYTAIDNYDGDITDKVTIEETENQVILKVSDSSNNETIETIPIVNSEIKDNYINLSGSKTIYIKQNSTYNEPGYSFVDGCNNKIESDIIVEGSVNTSNPGTYTLTYKTTYNEKEYTETRTIYVTPTQNTNGEGKVIYLTFDDGPGQYTDELLSILGKYNVKATFFVTNQYPDYQSMINKEYLQGHQIGIHSYTHKWNIYSSLNDYLNDFNQMSNVVYNQTGLTTKIFRFPGGSSNTVSKGYKKGVVTEIANYMTSNGYTYFDWNVDSGDAAGASSSQIYNNVINGISTHKYSVVLMHDIKPNTINIIEQILIYGIENHYTFKTLDTSSPTTHHKIAN